MKHRFQLVSLTILLLLGLALSGCAHGHGCHSDMDKDERSKPCDKPCEKPCHHKDGDKSAANDEAFKRATTEELALWLDKGEVAVIDNNTQEIFDAGHIPGAKHVAFDAVTADVLPKDKDARVVFYCANLKCGACHKAADAAIALGYTNVWIYAPGIEGWKAAGKKTEK